MTAPLITQTVVAAANENPSGSVSDRVRLALNKLAQVVAYMMPGVLTSAPASKTGTTSAKTWRVEAFNYVTRGLKAAKAATETAFTATTHDVAASKQAWFVLTIASGGALTITKAADQNIGTDVLPEAPDNQVIVAYAKLVTTAGGIWDATTDDFNVPGGPGNRVASLTIVDAPVLETIGSVE